MILEDDIESQIRDKEYLWNEKIEKAALNIGETSKGYKLMHIHAAQIATKLYTRLMFSGIVIGPLAGVLSGIGAALNPEKDPIIPIIVIILGFLSGIVVAITKLKFDKALFMES